MAGGAAMLQPPPWSVLAGLRTGSNGAGTAAAGKGARPEGRPEGRDGVPCHPVGLLLATIGLQGHLAQPALDTKVVPCDGQQPHHQCRPDDAVPAA
ncbi:hypothetical protein HaLaN_27643, partial [Haematococcus lacustris]